MSKLLSQAEVDALLNGLTGGEVDTASPSEPELEILPGEVVAYDFRGTGRETKLGLPIYEETCERFAQIFQDSLGVFIRRKAEFAKVGTELRGFEDFVRSLIVPTSLNVWRPSPLRGPALLILQSQFVFNIVEIFFGGKGGGDFKIEGRDFTAIEQQLIARMVKLLLRDISRAWESVYPIQPQLVRSEINPQFVKIVPPDESVIVTTFRADLHNVSGNIQLCIPVPTLEPIRGILSAAFQSNQSAQEVDRAWQRRLSQALCQVPVEIVVELGRTAMTGRKLLELKPGEIIRLPEFATAPVTAKVAGQPKIQGFLGQVRGNKAFQVSVPPAKFRRA
ncbi:MAG: flagellar motor switch protein FliM [Pseudomonadota bacterium]